LPRFRETVAVEKPEDCRDDQQNDFVERPWDRRYAECAAPPKRSWDPAVADDDLDYTDCPGDEVACGSHAASLGRAQARAREVTARRRRLSRGA